MSKESQIMYQNKSLFLDMTKIANFWQKMFMSAEIKEDLMSYESSLVEA